MEILYIIIGILSAISTFAIGYSVMGVFKIQKQMESVFGYIDTIQRKQDSTENDIHRRIDMEIEDTHRTFRDVEVDLRSQLDSRLDKLTNQIIKKIPPTNEDVLSELKQLKEEFLTLRKNL